MHILAFIFLFTECTYNAVCNASKFRVWLVVCVCVSAAHNAITKGNSIFPDKFLI